MKRIWLVSLWSFVVPAMAEQFDIVQHTAYVTEATHRVIRNNIQKDFCIPVARLCSEYAEHIPALLRLSDLTVDAQRELYKSLERVFNFAIETPGTSWQMLYEASCTQELISAWHKYLDISRASIAQINQDPITALPPYYTWLLEQSLKDTEELVTRFIVMSKHINVWELDYMVRMSVLNALSKSMHAMQTQIDVSRYLLANYHEQLRSLLLNITAILQEPGLLHCRSLDEIQELPAASELAVAFLEYQDAVNQSVSAISAPSQEKA